MWTFLILNPVRNHHTCEQIEVFTHVNIYIYILLRELVTLILIGLEKTCLFDFWAELKIRWIRLVLVSKAAYTMLEANLIFKLFSTLWRSKELSYEIRNVGFLKGTEISVEIVFHSNIFFYHLITILCARNLLLSSPF